MEGGREMEKQFVPYELAVKLKELGYPQDNIGLGYVLGDYYNTDGDFNGCCVNVIKDRSNKLIKAILWQQAFDWFREKGYPSWVYESSNRYWYKIVDKDWWHGNTHDEGIITYESARLACLEKLIDLTTPSIRG